MYGSGRIRISYRSCGKQFWGRVLGAGVENRSPRIVISSEVEKSLPYAVKQPMCHTPETGNLFFPNMYRNRFYARRLMHTV